MLTSGINHVAILTEDVDRFCAFYADVFGATVVFAETTPAFRHAILSVGGDGVLHPVEVATTRTAGRRPPCWTAATSTTSR
jgi:catechol 2,3-dioxygenase-like lactoylglutathione lyase family enzyme